MSTGALKGRAASYYSFMAGALREGRYSSFVSPAFKRANGKDAIKQMDAMLDPSKLPPSSYDPAKASDVAVAVEGRFAITSIRPELGTAFTRLDPVRWVRVGLRWYIFNGNSAETQAYGQFPPVLTPPRPPQPKEQAVKKRETKAEESQPAAAAPVEPKAQPSQSPSGEIEVAPQHPPPGAGGKGKAGGK